jgi:tetratricopeptide (TPR) repeat protein
MVDPTPSDYNLTYLRERWERDRSSRIFLQLAEEYRRRGLHAEALEVLQTGLASHPGYLAAQVALGRCRLEAGQAEEAVKVLEKVLTQDPTQAVATRLLAESWLQLGDEDRAQSAIDRCRLIGMSPSEAVALEQRLAAMRRAARERWAESPAVAPEPVEPPPTLAAVEETPLPWAEAEAEIKPEPEPEPAPAAPAPPTFSPPQVSRVAAAPAPPAPVPAPVRAAAAVTSAPAIAAAAQAAPAEAPSVAAAPSQPFNLPPRPRGVVLPLRPLAERSLVGGRRDPFGAAARLRSQLGARGEIFRLLPPPVPEAAAPAAELPSAPELAAPQAPAPPPAPVREAPAPRAVEAVAPPKPAAARWWDRPAEPAASAPPTIAPVVSSPPPAAPVAAPAARVSVAPLPPPEIEIAAPRSEVAAAPEPVPAPPTTTPPTAAPIARSPLAETPGLEIQASGALEVPELRPSDPGTATLGDLYLRQGYVREAEEIFRQVLSRDADNEAALAGLEAIGRRRAQKLTAAELLTGEEEKEVRGLTARKIQLLTRYLRALKRGAGHVPGTAQ